jgi:hypothetical protein
MTREREGKIKGGREEEKEKVKKKNGEGERTREGERNTNSKDYASETLSQGYLISKKNLRNKKCTHR